MGGTTTLSSCPEFQNACAHMTPELWGRWGNKVVIIHIWIIWVGGGWHPVWLSKPKGLLTFILHLVESEAAWRRIPLTPLISQASWVSVVIMTVSSECLCRKKIRTQIFALLFVWKFWTHSYAPTVGSWWCQWGVMAVSVCYSWRGNGLIVCEQQRHDCTQLCSPPQVCPGCLNPRTKKGLYMTVFFLSCFIVCLYLNVRYLSMRMFIDLLRVELLSSSPSESCTEMCAVESHYVDCVPTW